MLAESLVRGPAERTVRRGRLHVGQARGQFHASVELARCLRSEHVPLVDAPGRRVPPGAGLQHPPSLVPSALEKQAGEVVKPRHARAVGIRTQLLLHVRRNIQHARQHGQIGVAHRTCERDLEQHRPPTPPRPATRSRHAPRACLSGGEARARGARWRRVRAAVSPGLRRLRSSAALRSFTQS